MDRRGLIGIGALAALLIPAGRKPKLADADAQTKAQLDAVAA